MEEEKPTLAANIVRSVGNALVAQSQALIARGLRDFESSQGELGQAAYEVGQECEAAGRDAGDIRLIQQANVHFRRAAEFGHYGGASSLAESYDAGVGVEQNPAEATRWWKKAAEYNRQLFWDGMTRIPTSGADPYYPTEIFNRLGKILPKGEAEEAKKKLASLYARVLKAESSGSQMNSEPRSEMEFVFASNEFLAAVMSLEGRMGELTESEEDRKAEGARRQLDEAHEAYELKRKARIKRYKEIFGD